MYRIDISRGIRNYYIRLYQEVVEKMITNSEILKFICDKPATVDEIAKHFGLKTRTARYRIFQLKAQRKLREYINFKDMRKINYISVDAVIVCR
jgi:predicted transcriptional regulator